MPFVIMYSPVVKFEGIRIRYLLLSCKGGIRVSGEKYAHVNILSYISLLCADVT